MPGLDELLNSTRDDYRSARPVSGRHADAAASVLPGGNTRSVLDFRPHPFRVAGVDGPYLIDVDGHRYLDLLGNYSAGLLGHRPPAVADAVRAVLDQGWSLGAITSAEAELARLLADRFDSIDQVRFTNSGTEANLMAIATAKHVTGRQMVLAFHAGYHGGVLYHGEGGTALLVPHQWEIAEYNDTAGLQTIFDSLGEQIACVIVEPMLAASGCIPGSRSFLEELRRLTAEHGSILIFDEVMTSRLSRGGAQALLGITPDMTTLGKYLAGGLPFGAFGGSRELMAVFDPNSGGTLAHGGTFNNDEMSLAAGIAAVGTLLDESTLESLNERGDRLRSGLVEAFADAGVPMCATGLGSLLTVHGTAGPVERVSDLDGSDDRLKELLFFDLLAAGYYMARRGFMALSLDITDEHVDGLLDEVSGWAIGLAGRIG